MTKTIHEALFMLQGELRGVKKDATNPHFKAKYASLEQVTDTIRPHMQAFGLYWLQFPGAVVDGALEVTTRIVHAPTGQEIAFTMQMPLAKRDPQGAGSAMTYAMRYSLMGALGLPPTDDDAETAIDRDNKRPEPEKVSKNAVARDVYKYLQDDLRNIDNIDDARRWWKDADVKEQIRKLPDDWAASLHDEWISHGKALSKANYNQVGDTVADIVKKTGGKVVNDTFVQEFIDGK